MHSVRVLNCQGSGTNADILAGVDWVTTNAIKPAVVNYSIGCQSRCTDVTMDNAVKSLIASGVSWVQAAGNSNDDACFYSPQNVPEADHRRQHDQSPTPRPAPATTVPAWTSGRPAPTSSRPRTPATPARRP